MNQLGQTHLEENNRLIDSSTVTERTHDHDILSLVKLIFVIKVILLKVISVFCMLLIKDVILQFIH